MTPRRAALAAALVTALAVVGAVVALTADRSAVLPTARTTVVAAEDAVPAPELAGITAFDNTATLTLAGLRGRVVLVDFWTYTCINCRRTFPFLRALHETYPELTVLGVHSPEFGFEKSHANVARAVRELDVTWPVAEDPDMTTWRAFRNQYWPADYLVDRQGRLRWYHAGEGDEAELEQAVRDLLDEGGTAPAARTGDVDEVGSPGSGLTPETYAGSLRGRDQFAAGVVPSGSTVVRHDRSAGRDLLVLDGSFTGADEHLELGAGAAVEQRFRARDVYATMAPRRGPVVLDVTLDGRPVPAARRGPSLQVEGGRTVAHLRADDLLHLLTGPGVVEGRLRIEARSAGARLFTLTYGG